VRRIKFRINQLYQVFILDLSHNNLEYFGRDYFDTQSSDSYNSLTELRLNYNRIKHLDLYEKLPNLISVFFDFNQVIHDI
jgi:Leucine-rich repeat (LRR) protein